MRPFINIMKNMCLVKYAINPIQQMNRIPYYRFSANMSALEQQKQINKIYAQMNEESTSDKQKQNLLNEAIQFKTEIFKSQGAKRGFYSGYHKDLLDKAQLYFLNGEIDSCDQLLQSLLTKPQEELLTEFEDHVDNFSFLSEVYAFASVFYKEQKKFIEAFKYGIICKDFHMQEMEKLGINFQQSETFTKLSPELLIFYTNFIFENLQNMAVEFNQQNQTHKAREYLQIMCMVQNEILNVLQNVIEKFKNKAQVDTKLTFEQVSQLFPRYLLRQADTYQNLAQICLEDDQTDDCLSFLDAAENFYKFLIQLKVIDEQNNLYLNCQLITLQAQYQVNQTEDLQDKVNQLVQKVDHIEKNHENLQFRFNLKSFELGVIDSLEKQFQKLNELKYLVNEDPKLIQNIIQYNHLNLRLNIQMKNFAESLKIAISQINLLKENQQRSHKFYVESITKAGQLCGLNNRYEEALMYLDEGMELTQQDQQSYEYLEVIKEKAKILTDLYVMNNMDEKYKQDALQLFQKAEQIAIQMDSQSKNAPLLSLQICEEIAQFYETTKDFDKARQQLSICREMIVEHFPLSEQRSVMLSRLDERYKKL